MVDFGFTDVSLDDKKRRVNDVFSSVAADYDSMNDYMSLGLHRLWKRHLIAQARIRPGYFVLDCAVGSGDIALGLAAELKGEGWLCCLDINREMMRVGQQRFQQYGNVSWVQADAQQIPLASSLFDVITISFGLRNVPDRSACLREFYRVLQPMGRCLVLEFSMPEGMLASVYEQYLLHVLPAMGQFFVDQEAAYRYLGESIIRYPRREEVSALMREAGFDEVRCHVLSQGIVTLHEGIKW